MTEITCDDAAEFGTSCSKAGNGEDYFMIISELIDAEILIGFFKDVIQIGFIPGFMITSIMHLLGYGIFKTLSILNIRS